LVPTIKFACSKNIMGEFALSTNHLVFATAAGTLLFLMNFVIIFITTPFTEWWEYAAIGAFALVYIVFIFMAITEKTKPLRNITKEELEDHEYERLTVIE
jgi:hypothetical protein